MEGYCSKLRSTSQSSSAFHWKTSWQWQFHQMAYKGLATTVFSKEQKLDWVDMLFLATRPVEERSLAFWPTKPSTLRDTLDKYSLELANVSAQLFKFMANNPGVNQEALLGIFKGLPQSMRINYYRPCSQANKVLGLSPHTDGVGMTFLLQVNDVEGL